MKKKITIIFAALFVFALFGAIFALSGTSKADAEKSAASCPMHEKNTVASADKSQDSHCGMADCCRNGECAMGGACCKDNDSCPLKKSLENNSAETMDMSKVTVASDGDSCCQPGAACCQGGACCHHKKG